MWPTLLRFALNVMYCSRGPWREFYEDIPLEPETSSFPSWLGASRQELQQRSSPSNQVASRHIASLYGLDEVDYPLKATGEDDHDQGVDGAKPAKIWIYKPLDEPGGDLMPGRLTSATLQSHLAALRSPSKLQQLYFHFWGLVLPAQTASYPLSHVKEPTINSCNIEAALSMGVVEAAHPPSSVHDAMSTFADTKSPAAGTHKAPGDEHTQPLGASWTDNADPRLDFMRPRGHDREMRVVVPAYVNDSPQQVLAGYMTSENFVTEKLATSLGMRIDRRRGHRPKCVNAVGKTFYPLGAVTLQVAFPDEPNNKMQSSFLVVKDCVADMVLGSTFLKTTEVFTRRKRRQTRIKCTGKLPRLCYMGGPNRRLSCTLDGETVRAEEEIGSEIDVVSKRYATMRQWEIHELLPDEQHAVLIDRSIVKLEGYVKVVMGFGRRSGLQCFFVLDNLQCDVLFGDQTIHDLFAPARDKDSFFVNRCKLQNDGTFNATEWMDQVEDHITSIIKEELPMENMAQNENDWRQQLREALSSVPPGELGG